MNYLKIYYQIIAKAAGRKESVIYEKHHIVPRGLGGPDIPANIIYLTPKEHVVAHHLLAKAYPNEEKLQGGFNIKSLKKHNYSRWMHSLQNMVRDLSYTSHKKETLNKIQQLLNILNIKDIDVLVPALPTPGAGVPKKKPDIFECGIGGSNPEEKLNTALELLGNEVKASEIFNEGEFVDAIATTKGKGFQGVVKRWGIRIQYGKAVRAGKGRHVGSIGPWTPRRTMWTVAQAGQMGYHKRTEFNKRILKIASADEVDQINPDGGFVKYGVVKNDYVLVKGSLPGPSKRLVILRQPIRPNNKAEDIPQITYISTKSKQGV